MIKTRETQPECKTRETQSECKIIYSDCVSLVLFIQVVLCASLVLFIQVVFPWFYL
jgi:hypothetical protein